MRMVSHRLVNSILVHHDPCPSLDLFLPFLLLSIVKSIKSTKSTIMANSNQPNFQLLGTALDTASVEMQKIQNIPALQQGSQILSILQSMQGQMTSMQGQMASMQTQITEVQNQLSTL
jgi:hypothetical protein